MHNKRVSNILLIAITFLFSITFIFPTKVYSAGSKADIAIEVQAGFDGAARLGAYIPYRILLINKGRAVDGEVQVEIKIDSQNKTVFAKPVSLAAGVSKEIVIDAPVFTARKGVKVKFLEAGKTLKELEYNFTKLIPPEMKTIGVLSSDNAAYDFLNGMMIPQLNGDRAYDEKMKVMMAAGMYPSAASSVTSQAVPVGSVAKVESILIPLDGESFPDDIRIMNGFDVLIISNYDTGTLSEDQMIALDNWTENGGTLVIGTGANWKKVYSSLPEDMKRFSVSGTSAATPPEELEDFAEEGFSGNTILDTVTGDIGFEYEAPEEDRPNEANEGDNNADGSSSEAMNKDTKKPKEEKEFKNKADEAEKQLLYSAHVDEVIIGDSGNPLAVKYIYKSGRILFLAFDPGMEPVASWQGRQTFWENLLYHSSNSNRIYERGNGYYYSNQDIYYTNSLTSQVPDDRTPPFLFMFITIGVYIIIAGPAMYIFLKRKDKRDFSWLAVPAVATLCLLVIYFVGFKTRYKTAVFNTASMIYLDMENQKVDITTGMGVFNNKRGDLKLTYSNEDNIEFDVTQISNRSYVVYNDGREPEGKVVSKIVFGELMNYMIYDVSMWEPKYLSAKKSEPFTDEIIGSVQIDDGKLRALVSNRTKYDFMEAFITVGNNFISAGDILSGKEKVIEADFNSDKVFHSLEEYLEAQYGRTNYPSNVKLPDDFQEKFRKRMTVEQLIQPMYYSLRGQTKIGLYALNNQNLGLDISINDETPVSYYTNGIFSSVDMTFEKGGKVDIPAGVILPQIDEYGPLQNIASLDGDNGVSIMNKGDIDFTYSLPESIRPTEFSLEFDTYVPLYVKYNIEDFKAENSNMQTQILQNEYEYYLYNKASDSWEQINDTHIEAKEAYKYVDDENKLKVRVRVVEMAGEDRKSYTGYVEQERLAFPALQLKGVAR